MSAQTGRRDPTEEHLRWASLECLRESLCLLPLEKYLNSIRKVRWKREKRDELRMSDQSAAGGGEVAKHSADVRSEFFSLITQDRESWAA